MEWEGKVVAAHHKLAAMERRMSARERSHAQTGKRYDREFHHALICACSSQVLLEMHAHIYDRYLRYQTVAAVYRGDVASDEHRRPLDCALDRDWKDAQGTLTKHVQDCVKHMIDKRLATSAVRSRAFVGSTCQRSMKTRMHTVAPARSIVATNSRRVSQPCGPAGASNTGAERKYISCAGTGSPRLSRSSASALDTRRPWLWT